MTDRRAQPRPQQHQQHHYQRHAASVSVDSGRVSAVFAALPAKVPSATPTPLRLAFSDSTAAVTLRPSPLPSPSPTTTTATATATTETGRADSRAPAGWYGERRDRRHADYAARDVSYRPDRRFEALSRIVSRDRVSVQSATKCQSPPHPFRVAAAADHRQENVDPRATLDSHRMSSLSLTPRRDSDRRQPLGDSLSSTSSCSLPIRYPTRDRTRPDLKSPPMPSLPAHVFARVAVAAAAASSSAVAAGHGPVRFRPDAKSVSQAPSRHGESDILRDADRKYDADRRAFRILRVVAAAADDDDDDYKGETGECDTSVDRRRDSVASTGSSGSDSSAACEVGADDGDGEDEDVSSSDSSASEVSDMDVAIDSEWKVEPVSPATRASSSSSSSSSALERTNGFSSSPPATSSVSYILAPSPVAALSSAASSSSPLRFVRESPAIETAGDWSKIACAILATFGLDPTRVLIGVDLDDTVLRPRYLHPDNVTEPMRAPGFQWLHALPNDTASLDNRESGRDDDDDDDDDRLTLSRALDAYSQALHEKVLMDPMLPFIFRELRRRGFRLFALTSRSAHQRRVTLRALDDLGVRFDADHPFPKREIFDPRSGVLCADGILWTNGRSKGPELYRLLTHLAGLGCEPLSHSEAAVSSSSSAIAAPAQMRLPAHIVFVDNLLHNVESVRDVCGRLVPIHGYHYVPTATDAVEVGAKNIGDDDAASASAVADNDDGEAEPLPTTTTLEVGSDGALENATVSVSRQSQLVDAPVLAPFRAHAHRLVANRSRLRGAACTRQGTNTVAAAADAGTNAIGVAPFPASAVITDLGAKPRRR